MSHHSEFEEEAQQILKSSMDTLGLATTASSDLPAGEIIKLTAWVTRLGEIVRQIYGDASEPYKMYVNANAAPSFSQIHSNWHAHIAELVGVAQRLTDDIENGRTPKHPHNSSSSSLTDEQGLWWFFQHCTTKTRNWMIVTSLTILATCISLAYVAGRIKFIGQIIDLWNNKPKP